MPLLKLWAGSLVMLAAVSLPLRQASPVESGLRKMDSEGALLGNLTLQVLESHGVPTVNEVPTRNDFLWCAGRSTPGELDITAEYTGNEVSLVRTMQRGKTRRRGYEKVEKAGFRGHAVIWLTPAPANNLDYRRASGCGREK
ncbi:glycine betaine ABC transporter substrate-binding protein [Escherichia coli]